MLTLLQTLLQMLMQMLPAAAANTAAADSHADAASMCSVDNANAGMQPMKTLVCWMQNLMLMLLLVL
jgi:uncharacterized membrane protein YqiK